VVMKEVEWAFWIWSEWNTQTSRPREGAEPERPVAFASVLFGGRFGVVEDGAYGDGGRVCGGIGSSGFRNMLITNQGIPKLAKPKGELLT